MIILFLWYNILHSIHTPSDRALLAVFRKRSLIYCTQFTPSDRALLAVFRKRPLFWPESRWDRDRIKPPLVGFFPRLVLQSCSRSAELFSFCSELFPCALPGLSDTRCLYHSERWRHVLRRQLCSLYPRGRCRGRGEPRRKTVWNPVIRYTPE